MTEEEKILYLANVVAVARADEQVTPNESHVLNEIQKMIGAKKASMNKARLLAESSEFAIEPVGCFSARISNLEDMVYVAIVDGNLDERERPAIVEFARKVNVTNEQFQGIVGEAKNALDRANGSRACPGCGSTVPSSAKFCPECGGSLELEDREASTAISYDIPNEGIAIEFAESTAAGFLDAVEKARKAPHHADCIKGKKTWYLAAWPKEAIGEVLSLVKDLKGMRNRRVWLDGNEGRWDEVFGFAWCKEQRDSAYRPLEYCFGVSEKRLNLWGCVQCRMDWANWSDWFSYGEFKKEGLLKHQAIFVFDKKRIRHELETNLFRVRNCPHLDFKLINAVLDALPDEVHPQQDGPWGFKREYQESPGSIKVTETRKENGYTFRDEFYASGVAPKSASQGLLILREAINKLGRVDSDMNAILRYSD